jgi:hypothetical protein
MVAYIKSDVEDSAGLVEQLDTLVREQKARGIGLHACAVFLGDSRLAPSIRKLAAERNVKIPLLFMAERSVPEGYQLNPMVRNTVLTLVDHRTVASLVNVDAASFGRLRQTADRFVPSSAPGA